MQFLLAYIRVSNKHITWSVHLERNSLNIYWTEKCFQHKLYINNKHIVYA